MASKVLVDILRGGLTENSVDRLSFSKAFQHRHLAAFHLAHQPHCVHGGEESSWTSSACGPERLEKAVSNEALEQTVAMTLKDSSGVVGSVHGGEIKHGYVRLAVVVDGKVKVRQLAFGRKVGRLSGRGME